MSPVLHAREVKKRPPPISVRIPKDLLVEIETAREADGLKLNRSEAIVQLLRFAIAEHKKDASKKPKK